MEPEQIPNSAQGNGLENLKKVTPLSKYLAMTLFVALPFIGGWIGYTLMPEKVVEVEKVVYENLDGEDITQPRNVEETLETEKVFNKDGKYAPDGQMLDDKDLYEQTGLPYVTAFSKDYPLYV